MKFKKIYGLIVLGLGFLLFVAGPISGANYLKDIQVQRAGDSLVVIVSTTQADKYNLFLTESKPERIVIDLEEVVNSWVRKKFTELPFRSITAIRTSQFQLKPYLVTRVVLDIGRPIDFRSFRKGNDVVIKLPVIEGEDDFASWSALGRGQAPEKTKEAPRQKVKAPQKMPTGIKIESYPKRKLVGYRTSGFRDPFVPLIGGIYGQLSGELPALENLMLVGILEDIDGNRALLEDAGGNGYIMMPNDKIKNGYLVSVSGNKAIFQITEYGWTRTVALELDVPELK